MSAMTKNRCGEDGTTRRSGNWKSIRGLVGMRSSMRFPPSSASRTEVTAVMFATPVIVTVRPERVASPPRALTSSCRSIAAAGPVRTSVTTGSCTTSRLPPPEDRTPSDVSDVPSNARAWTAATTGVRSGSIANRSA